MIWPREIILNRTGTSRVWTEITGRDLQIESPGSRPERSTFEASEGTGAEAKNRTRSESNRKCDSEPRHRPKVTFQFHHPHDNPIIHNHHNHPTTPPHSFCLIFWYYFSWNLIHIHVSSGKCSTPWRLEHSRTKMIEDGITASPTTLLLLLAWTK